MEAELAGLHKYDAFKDMGKVIQPPGCNKIRTHFIFAVKRDLRHKGRIVTDGHLTEATHEGAYSGVVLLRSMRICILLAEPNGLDIMVGDLCSTYLEALTKEKVYGIAGPEYGELEGHTLIIRKALYGLRTSGARYHERFSDTLHAESYLSSQLDPDVWMKDCITHYEYVCICGWLNGDGQGSQGFHR
jgi:hypothetical protein